MIKVNYAQKCYMNIIPPFSIHSFNSFYTKEGGQVRQEFLEGAGCLTIPRKLFTSSLNENPKRKVRKLYSEISCTFLDLGGSCALFRMVSRHSLSLPLTPGSSGGG